MRQGIKFLIKEHSLDIQESKKVPVYIEDMVLFNKTILLTQEKKFWLGFERIQKNALLSLQYKGLQFSLQTDPKGGPSIPLVELTAKSIKRFMGSTDLYICLPNLI
uniref:Uncharacterized protein n=1 Tax=Coccidioides posadasii RMSCC 3488 TaxID=454284 RepID=A0A0J6FCC2_COCPO|nr:hypothetical protein CPAG_06962 [Coccidioides posadasii RMSCC 3488]